MLKPVAYFTLCFAIIVICFATWQLFCGNLAAAFSALPFLLIIYLYVLTSHRNRDNDPTPP